MDHFIEFAKLNWYLFAAFFIVLLLIIITTIQRRVSGILTISNQALLRLSNDDEAIIVDVRDVAVFRKGHISASINVPMAEIAAKASELHEKHKDKSVILVCQTGARSFQAAATFKKYNFPAVYSLNAGIDGWKQDNLPLSKHK